MNAYDIIGVEIMMFVIKLILLILAVALIVWLAVFMTEVLFARLLHEHGHERGDNNE